MLTVGELVSELGLKLVAGADDAGRSIRWVHISELEDPTQWLSGDELLLTTGIQLDTAARQRRFVRLLSDHGVAGLGLGTGFDHDSVPKALATEAEKRGLPLFEVPYEMPFIALTERAFTQLVNEQYSVLERGTALHERLERLVLEGQGLVGLLDAASEAVEGASCVLDARGRVVAKSLPAGLRRGDEAPSPPTRPRSASVRSSSPYPPGDRGCHGPGSQSFASQARWPTSTASPRARARSRSRSS
jgi:purine catabolism regulator